jgi:hypothetical protein
MPGQGPDRPLRVPAVYNLLWDPGEQYDMDFNGAAPTGGSQTSPGRSSGSDNGWAGRQVLDALVERIFGK